MLQQLRPIQERVSRVCGTTAGWPGSTLLRRFFYRDDLVGVDVLKLLDDAAGPPDLDGLRGVVGAQAEVSALVVGGEITPSGAYGGPLWSFAGGELDLGTDAVAIGFVSYEAEEEPVVGGGGLVVEDVGWSAVRGDDGVEAAVVVEVTHGHTPADPGLLEDGA